MLNCKENCVHGENFNFPKTSQKSLTNGDITVVVVEYTQGYLSSIKYTGVSEQHVSCDFVYSQTLWFKCWCVWQVEKLKKQSHQREGKLKVKSRPGERSKDSLRLLKDMRTLQTSLCTDQHHWDYWHLHTPLTRNQKGLAQVCGVDAHREVWIVQKPEFTVKNSFYFCAKKRTRCTTSPVSEEKQIWRHSFLRSIISVNILKYKLTPWCWICGKRCIIKP